MRILIVASLLIASFVATLYEVGNAQVQLSGRVGVLGEGYTVDGISARRVPLKARGYVNVNFSLFGLKSGFQLMYDTEDSRVRQSMNQLGFSTSWAWGKMSAGDVAPRISRYSLSGAVLRGGFIELTPRFIHLSLAAGRARRAIEPTTEARFAEPVFERWIYSVGIGIGKKEGSHFLLATMLARDARSSLEFSGEARPAENVIVTPQVGIALFQRKFRLSGEVSVSAFTRDMRAEAIALPQGIPGWVSQIFQPRISSFVDFAGTGELNIQLKSVGLKGIYERIGTGYESLGISQLRNDQEILGIEPRIRVWDRKVELALKWRRQRNNLLDQRTHTLWRKQIGGSLRLRPIRVFHLNVAYQRLLNETRSDTEVQQGLLNQTLSVNPIFILQTDRTVHTVMLNGIYQDLSTQVGSGTSFSNLTGMVNYSLSLPSGVAFNLGGNILQSTSQTVETQVLSGMAGGSVPLFKRLMTVGINGSWSQSKSVVAANQETATQLSGTLQMSIRMFKRDQLQLLVRGLINKGRQDFRELQSSIRFEHRF